MHHRQSYDLGAGRRGSATPAPTQEGSGNMGFYNKLMRRR